MIIVTGFWDEDSGDWRDSTDEVNELLAEGWQV
jgi:hypothetical protein